MAAGRGHEEPPSAILEVAAQFGATRPDENTASSRPTAWRMPRSPWCSSAPLPAPPSRRGQAAGRASGGLRKNAGLPPLPGEELAAVLEEREGPGRFLDKAEGFPPSGGPLSRRSAPPVRSGHRPKTMDTSTAWAAGIHRWRIQRRSLPGWRRSATGELGPVYPHLGQEGKREKTVTWPII